tara:strand:- start:1434 stop:1676 length:243 start_codon:yes stop_codon:yes gene_type:complete
MKKTDLYSFSVLNHLAKKIYEQNAKIDLILKYIIEKNNLTDEFYEKINETVIESNIECVNEINKLYDIIDDKTNPSDFLK